VGRQGFSSRLRKINKPWGYELIWADTKNYIAKIIFINQGCRLSLQYHQKKEETVYVMEGTLINDDNHHQNEYSAGEYLHVPPGKIHRFCATKDSPVKLMEVSSNHPDDVIRVEDDYNR